MEEEDFYIENGYYVFTEKYHLKRGYCCKSACRHCPWNYKKNLDKQSSKIKNFLKNDDKN